MLRMVGVMATAMELPPTEEDDGDALESDVPARLDRLPWSRVGGDRYATGRPTADKTGLSAHPLRPPAGQ